MTEGPERAKKNCIDHANSKRQTALMVACKHGHPDCVEYLVTNGGDPLLTDERRHNTCLHFAALYGHSECVHKLLGSRAAYRVQGRQVPVAQIPCADDGSTVKFIDRHNGWGLSALHIAVFQGSVSTVRALLRHGADIESVICAAKVENSPIRCAVGSNALHIAALTGNIIMAKLILETQENYPGLELRGRTNAAGLKPHDYAQSARNPVLLHLLDERLPVSLLRQIWMNYSLEPSMPPRHQTLGSMLQKLKLMFNLELIAIQRNVSYLQAQHAAAAAQLAQQQQHAEHTTARAGTAPHQHGTAEAAEGAEPSARKPAAAHASSSPAHAGCGPGAAPGAGATSTLHAKHRCMEPGNILLPWARRQDEITQLLSTVTQLHDSLKQLCRREDPTPGDAGEANRAERAATYEAVLDFILSTLITPRTVSAVLHAAKKVVSASVTGSAALSTGGAPMELPPGDSDAQHGLALLSTALRAVETCLQGAVYLTSPAALKQQTDGPASGVGRTGGLPTGGNDLATSSAPPHGGDAVAAVDPFLLPGGPGLIAIPVEPLGVGLGNSAAMPRGEANAAAVTAANTANLVSDALVEVQAQGAAALQGSPRASMALAGHSTVTIGAAGLVVPPSGLRGISDGPTAPAFATHWSAQLHTLIAQLQWDIGVQRHRRRRAHAAAAAARNAAANAATAAAASGNTAGANAGAHPGAVLPNAQHRVDRIDVNTIQLEEIIPVVPVSTVLAQSRAHAAAAAAAASAAGESRTPTGAAASKRASTGASTGEQRREQRGKDRAKDRDGTGGGVDGGGGLDGPDDTPAASESGSDWSDDDRNVCSICMDLPVAVLVAGCQHGLCVQCAFQLCVKGRELPSCPFCRQKIGGFEPKEAPGAAATAATAAAAAR
ncbi:hypothetical protein GPECTOR_41g662 [Gonium pectorale]|uniref:RING-type domain-containing protein n=1 Tax=Gonium pectorale TaxID=33097 RepID=A0A150GA46_GONPE|nr:hypothetical protein GPECTOR_41g662 [Gonium pectorale]|eukprot:KXZ46698.1 hypothetical protein GPECTOR_41g662 [Gonium pectorale]